MKFDGSATLTIGGQSFDVKSINWEEKVSAAREAAAAGIPLGVTRGTYTATGSFTVNQKAWNRLVKQQKKEAWELPGGNSHDRRKRRRAAQRAVRL